MFEGIGHRALTRYLLATPVEQNVAKLTPDACVTVVRVCIPCRNPKHVGGLSRMVLLDVMLH